MNSAPTQAPEAESPFVVMGHGPVLNAAPTHECPRCGTWEDPSCDCHRLGALCRLFNAAQIPALYIHATLCAVGNDGRSSPSLKKAATWVQAWAWRERLPEHGLTLHGPTGVGKTFLMAALARTLTLERGIACLFVDFGRLLLRLKAAFNGNGSEYEIFDTLQQPHVLIIDDVGSHRDSAWPRDVLQTIIAGRYNACARTFVTTNLSARAETAGSLSPFEHWAGPHCASRMAEMCIPVLVDGPDRRRRHGDRFNPVPPQRT